VRNLVCTVIGNKRVDPFVWFLRFWALFLIVEVGIMHHVFSALPTCLAGSYHNRLIFCSHLEHKTGMEIAEEGATTAMVAVVGAEAMEVVVAEAMEVGAMVVAAAAVVAVVATTAAAAMEAAAEAMVVVGARITRINVEAMGMLGVGAAFEIVVPHEVAVAVLTAVVALMVCFKLLLQTVIVVTHGFGLPGRCGRWMYSGPGHTPLSHMLCLGNGRRGRFDS
jgi:hypothetical protein